MLDADAVLDQLRHALRAVPPTPASRHKTATALLDSPHLPAVAALVAEHATAPPTYID